MNPLFPPEGDGGQNVTRNGGAQTGACLILSDYFLVTYSDASVTFFVIFCQTPCSGLLLRQGDFTSDTRPWAEGNPPAPQEYS